MTDDESTSAASDEEVTIQDKPSPNHELAMMNKGESQNRWHGLIILTLMFLMSCFFSTRTGQPSPASANAPETEFSSARAMSILVEIARQAHPPGSPEHERVRGYLVDRLTTLGLDPEIQTSTSSFQRRTMARTATVRNVIARLPGTASTGAILITAHYDSRGLAVGAGDDGTGVVSILETLRAIQTGPPLRNDVIVLFTDAEELGLLGARAFVNEHPWMEDIQLVLSFEMRGGGGPVIMVETAEDNGWIIDALQASDQYPFANAMAYEVYQRMPNDTDFTPFKEAGKQGLNFAAIDKGHVYHQQYDTPENLSESTLQHHGLHALHVLRYLGDQDLVNVNAPDVVYFSMPALGLFVYQVTWVKWISAGLIILLILALLAMHRSSVRLSGALIGAGISIVGASLSFGFALLLLNWLPRFHPEAGSLQGSLYHREGWYVIALAAAAFTIVTGLHALARKWLSIQQLALGALIVPFVGAILLGYTAPLAAMNLEWPVAAALMSVFWVTVMGERTTEMLGWSLAILFTVPVLSFFVPVAELLWIAMTFEFAPWLAVFITIGLYLCLPALDSVLHSNSWWAPTGGVITVGAALGFGILNSQTTAERPAPSTLVYAYEHGTPEALWATAPVLDRLDLPAREWAVERTGSAFGLMRDLSIFGYDFGAVPAAVAPAVDAPEPVIIIETDITIGDIRRVIIGVRSRIGSERLRFQYDPAEDTRLISINGTVINNPEELTWADHWGTPAPMVYLELEVPAGDPISFDIIEHLLRPEELLGPEVFSRPDYLAPDIIRESDRAMLLYRFQEPQETTEATSR